MPQISIPFIQQHRWTFFTLISFLNCSQEIRIKILGLNFPTMILIMRSSKNQIASNEEDKSAKNYEAMIICVDHNPP